MTEDRNNCCREGQKDKRMEIPMHDEGPSYKTEGFNPHRYGVKPQEDQGNRNVKIITGVSPIYQLANQAFLACLIAEKIANVYKKHLGNREHYEVMNNVYSYKFFHQMTPI